MSMNLDFKIVRTKIKSRNVKISGSSIRTRNILGVNNMNSKVNSIAYSNTGCGSPSPLPSDLEAEQRKNLPWDEITDTEKIDREREVIKKQSSKIDELDDMIAKLREMLNDHSHGNTGEALVPLKKSRIYNQPSEYLRDSGRWF